MNRSAYVLRAEICYNIVQILNAQSNAAWRADVLTDYIRAAMRRAQYEILSDGTFYGEIPGSQGVYANAKTLDDCREELQDVLEGWIVLGLRPGHSLPVVDGIDLAMAPETA